LKKQFGNGKLALLMKKECDFGKARLWEIITEYLVDIRTNVFLDFKKAKDWLNE
jgi:hypothetical protein